MDTPRLEVFVCGLYGQQQDSLVEAPTLAVERHMVRVFTIWMC